MGRALQCVVLGMRVPGENRPWQSILLTVAQDHSDTTDARHGF
jgi:hypothetical protein